MSDGDMKSGPTQLLRGTIRNYRKSRQNQDFMFTPGDRARMGATAIGAALVGLGGIAVGLASASLDTSETADLLEFDLDGKSIRAWVWQSVFQDGDEVEVVAESMGDVWQGYGIRRPTDRIVALHPHCSRGRLAHYRVSTKWWLKISIPIVLFTALVTSLFSYLDSGLSSLLSTLFFFLFVGGTGCLLVSGVIAWRIAKKFMGFVRLAEGIFTAFGWTDVKNIDLPALTKKTKQPGDPGVLGVLYFRH